MVNKIKFVAVLLAALMIMLPVSFALNDKKWNYVYEGTDTNINDPKIDRDFNLDSVRDYNVSTYVFAQADTPYDFKFNNDHCASYLLNNRVVACNDPWNAWASPGSVYNLQCDLEGKPEQILFPKGLNEFKVLLVGNCDGQSDHRGPAFLKYEEGGVRLSEQFSGMDSEGKFCEPSECCATQGGFNVFSPSGTSCAGGSGYCDGAGNCVNGDDSSAACKTQTGVDSDNVYLASASSNKCCGDDSSDCLAYNSGMACFPGQGWQPIAVGEIYDHPCVKDMSVVLGQNSGYPCVTGDYPINYKANFKVLWGASGDNKWNVLEPQPNTDPQVDSRILDEKELNLYYRPNDWRTIQTFFYAAEPKTLEFNVTTDSGVYRHLFIDDQHLINQGDYYLDTTRPTNWGSIGASTAAGATAGAIWGSFVPILGNIVGAIIGAVVGAVSCAFGGCEERPKWILVARPFTSAPVPIKASVSAGWHNIWMRVLNDNDLDENYDYSGTSAFSFSPLISEQADIMSSERLTGQALQEELPNIVLAKASQELGPVSGLVKFSQMTEGLYIGKILLKSLDENITVSFSPNTTITSTYDKNAHVYAKFIGNVMKTDFDIVPITSRGETHEYICSFPVNGNRKDIGECYGDGTGAPFSSGTVGYQNLVGDAYNLPDKKSGYRGHYYCTEKFTWAHDLDNPDYAQACINAEDLEGRKLKDVLKFGWTGNGCCSEEEDIVKDPTKLGETYNNPDVPGAPVIETGACFNSTKVDNGVVPFKGVIVHKGIFLGCGLPDNSLLFTYKDQLTNKTLITNKDACTVLENVSQVANNNYYCSLTGDWKFTSKSGERQTKTKLPASTFTDAQQDCCLTTECFDGKNCIPNEAEKTTSDTHFGYRCIDGEWIKQTAKFTWDYGKTGFCPRPQQCLVNPEGKAGNNDLPETYFVSPSEEPGCITNNQHIFQYLCTNGEWATRTKYVALQLLDFGELYHPGNYELFCDDYNNVLNFVGYAAIKGAAAVKDYIDNCQTFGGKCANQFCVLKFGGNQTAVGTSLNTPVNDPSKSFLFALGEMPSACNNAINDKGVFGQCGLLDAKTPLWFNNKLNSIIYLPEDKLEARTPEQLVLAQNSLLTGPLEELKKFVNEKEYAIQIPSGFINRTHLFENLYIVNKDSKKYFGFVEPSQSHIDLPAPIPVSFIGLNYKGFAPETEADACTFIRQIDPTFTGVCTYDADKKNLMMLRVSLANTPNPTLKAWNDLSAKLRFG